MTPVVRLLITSCLLFTTSSLHVDIATTYGDWGQLDECAQKLGALVCYNEHLCFSAIAFHLPAVNADLRGAQKLHSAACVAGMAVFALEDASVPHVPLVHASWHCLSALSTSLVNTVLADVEQQYPEFTLDALK